MVYSTFLNLEQISNLLDKTASIGFITLGIIILISLIIFDLGPKPGDPKPPPRPIPDAPRPLPPVK